MKLADIQPNYFFKKMRKPVGLLSINKLFPRFMQNWADFWGDYGHTSQKENGQLK